jgi:hypothetical protein
MTATVITTDLPLKVFTKGKVRDVYDLGDELLMVASDRISAFDVVMPTPIPDKGKILTQMSIFWFEVLKGVIPHHLITADVNDLPKNLSDYHEILSGRFMLVKKTKKFPIECVVRGYMAGSGWKEYQANGKICGIPLPPGLSLRPRQRRRVGNMTKTYRLKRCVRVWARFFLKNLKIYRYASTKKARSMPNLEDLFWPIRNSNLACSKMKSS